MIRAELGDSALFGLRFRQNAGRALLMPRPDPAKRSPLWLQRLRAKDLLQVVRRVPDFPILVETYRECLDEDLDLPRLRAFLDAIASGAIRVVGRRGETPSPFAADLIFRFTSQYMYQWDEPRRGDRPADGPAVDEDLLDPLLDPSSYAHWLDPGAIGRVEGRLRGAGHPPRTADEMAETLRRLGDLAPGELSGPMLAFLADLEAQGRAVAIELPGTSEPRRWIGAEDAPLYASAFPKGSEIEPDGSPTPSPSEDGVATIVRRFLQSHALIGLDDLTARYPIGPARARELLELLADDGGLVRLVPAGDPDAARWADARNLDEVRRLSIALRRRESVAVLPEVFADFLARRHHLHPSSRLEGSAAVGLILERLQGFAAPAALWETELFPRRIRDYRPAWLDETISTGGWLWRAEAGAEARGEPRVAFVPRDFQGGWPAREEVAEPSEDEVRVRDHLARRGASFASDLARELGLEPSRTRRALLDALRRGEVTNDRFDPMRPGAQAVAEALAEASAPRPSRRPTLGRPRPRLSRAASNRPEGRWSLLAAVATDPEAASLAWIAAMLDRYGVLTREMAALDAWAPPWRDLVPWLARAELRGELRRGYFVEGLSGVQYASAEAAEGLARLAAGGATEPEPILMSTLDPANLYGSGAPLDVPLLEGGTARLVRSPANYLVLCGGRPTLIIEAFGRRLTGLASASEAELRAAMSTVATLAGPSRRILKVETYNSAATLASPAAPWLADLGFVRDPPGMAFYAGW